MAKTDVPLCLKRAGEEIMLALGAESAASEGAHRLRAARLVTEAVQVIERDPQRDYDWSCLTEQA